MGQIPIEMISPAPSPPQNFDIKIDRENQGQLRQILTDITHLRRIMADYNHRIG